MTDVVRLGAGECLANAVHLAADLRELRQHRVDKSAVLVELGQSGVGDAIELLAAFGFDRGVADLFKIRQRRIDHARARCVETFRGVLKSLDDLVPMRWALLKQSQDDQLHRAGTQLAPSENPAPAESCTVPEPRAESTKVTAVRAPRAAAIEKKAVHFDLRGLL